MFGIRFGRLIVTVCIVGLMHAGQSLADTEREKYFRPNTIPSPPSNPLTAEKAALGKVLFFDPRLSRDYTKSCASCHTPTERWSDGLPIALGAENIEHPRRSPTVLNSAWLKSLMWDGRSVSLEDQAVMPITTPHEMNYDMDELVIRLNYIKGYYPIFQAAFGDEAINADRITQALASFQRTLVSPIAPFDLWIAGDEDAISESAKRGFEIFNGKANCAACHTSWRFTDDSFHDIGLDTTDKGRGAFVPPAVKIMQHAFKTPTLRELPINGPYMHNGAMTGLIEVIKHYEEGGIQRESLSPEMKPFELTEQERDSLVEFIKTLDGGILEVDIPGLPLQ